MAAGTRLIAPTLRPSASVCQMLQCRARILTYKYRHSFCNCSFNPHPGFHNPQYYPTPMSQNKEAAQFLSRIANLPKGPVSLDAVLQPSLDDEAELRKLFATDKGNARLKDIHVGLVDIFAAPHDIRTTRARVVNGDADRDAQYVMPLSDALRRKEGSPAMIDNLEAFKKNGSVFTEKSLSQLSEWSNVIAAGG